MSIVSDPAIRRKAERLAAIGHDLHSRGWVPATSGNFSMRIDGVSALVTASGRHKGELAPHDFLAVDLHGKPLSVGKPSAETLLHTQLYAWQPWIDTVLHCHSPHATVLSMHVRGDSLELRGYELLKAFRGIDTHEATLRLPVFANTQDIPALAVEVQEYLYRHDNCPAYLIRGHGVYVWGASAEESLRQLEALDFLLHCELLRLSLPRPLDPQS